MNSNGLNESMDSNGMEWNGIVSNRMELIEWNGIIEWNME